MARRSILSQLFRQSAGYVNWYLPNFHKTLRQNCRLMTAKILFAQSSFRLISYAPICFVFLNVLFQVFLMVEIKTLGWRIFDGSSIRQS